jgi:hypothetical protein
MIVEYWDNGVLKQRAANSDEEIADMKWHNVDKPVQVIIPEMVKRELLILNQEHEILGNHPEVAMLLGYVKTISASSVNEDGNLYIYLSEIFPEHKAFLQSFGIQINPRANV